MRKKERSIRVRVTEDRYAFLRDFCKDLSKTRKEKVTVSELVRLVLDHFFMSLLMGETDLKLTRDNFIERYGHGDHKRRDKSVIDSGLRRSDK